MKLLYTLNYQLIDMGRNSDIAVSIIRLVTVVKVDFTDIGYSVIPAALAALAEPAIAVIVACSISSRPVFEKMIPKRIHCPSMAKIQPPMGIEVHNEIVIPRHSGYFGGAV